MPFSRRSLLIGGAASLLAAGVDAKEVREFSSTMRAAFEARHGMPTALWLQRPSGEEIFADFRSPSGEWIASGITALSFFMRDENPSAAADAGAGPQGAAVVMDRRLFELLARTQSLMSLVHGSALPMTITSGYRTVHTNAVTEGAARNSLHTKGAAADCKIAPYSPAAVATAAASVSTGGIGLYGSFVHLDVGSTRSWGKSA